MRFCNFKKLFGIARASQSYLGHLIVPISQPISFHIHPISPYIFSNHILSYLSSLILSCILSHLVSYYLASYLSSLIPSHILSLILSHILSHYLVSYHPTSYLIRYIPSHLLSHISHIPFHILSRIPSHILSLFLSHLLSHILSHQCLSLSSPGQAVMSGRGSKAKAPHAFPGDLIALGSKQQQQQQQQGGGGGQEGGQRVSLLISAWASGDLGEARGGTQSSCNNWLRPIMGTIGPVGHYRVKITASLFLRWVLEDYFRRHSDLRRPMKTSFYADFSPLETGFHAVVGRNADRNNL